MTVANRCIESSNSTGLRKITVFCWLAGMHSLCVGLRSLSYWLESRPAWLASQNRPLLGRSLQRLARLSEPDLRVAHRITCVAEIADAL